MNSRTGFVSSEDRQLLEKLRSTEKRDTVYRAVGLGRWGWGGHLKFLFS